LNSCQPIRVLAIVPRVLSVNSKHCVISTISILIIIDTGSGIVNEIAALLIYMSYVYDKLVSIDQYGNVGS